MPTQCPKLRSCLSRWAFGTFVLAVTFPMGSNNPPTYPWKDSVTQERLQCQQCPPGTYVSQHCSRTSPTQCQPCPTLHYTQYWNYLDKCRYCNVFCGAQEEEVHPCSATHNRVCQCQSGYYTYMDFCIEHSTCPLGSGVVSQGTPTKNTQCQECPRGTFSDNSSRTEPCQSHQNCTLLGMKVNVPGNRFHDTLCTRCDNFQLNSSEPGNRDCEQALIDFVAYQDIPLKRLLRLQQVLGRRGGRRTDQGFQVVMQKKLLQQLMEKREAQTSDALITELLQALRTVKLYGLIEKIQKHFSLHMDNLTSTAAPWTLVL
ncbi:tumor necrosis factor receptor superfamily member 6B [Tachyglossus aculeatus]|uniref:tumor necrosis factor receptor superfamily member 6B n=1 Tax=Tachyglossus aculeatus TaxID=9261 RepID=UPI0018F7B8F7|nr:tumor necrosis factor receptor superfamily member 6B [Tachyglossus aculeatus]